MSMYQYMPLIFLVLCVSRTSCTINEPSDEDYKSDASHEYEHYDDGIKISTPLSVTATEMNSFETESPITLSPVQLSSTEVMVDKLSCPKNCTCLNTFQRVTCSFQMLDSIPDNLPMNLQRLDLSHNNLEYLNVTELNKYMELQELIIHNNFITKIINSKDFIDLGKLQFIDLSTNRLKTLNGTEFTKATNLAHLILSNNSGIADSNIIFAEIAKKLNTLEIVNCSIMELSNKIFENLPSLVVLDLRENPLKSNLNSEAFTPLAKLWTLRISSISEMDAAKLCKALKIIDVINTDKFDLSCFELSAGSTFDESTIKSTFMLTDDTDNLYKMNTNAPVHERMNSLSSKNTSRISTSLINETDIQASKQQMSSISQNEKLNLSLSGAALNKTDYMQKIESSQIDISTETIYFLLTGLIVVTLVSLIIGIICRLDCCGIKTKCCRRNHNNRALSQDHGQPHEEIPLNKV